MTLLIEELRNSVILETRARVRGRGPRLSRRYQTVSIPCLSVTARYNSRLECDEYDG
jgi:hypothetical protein